MEDVAGRVLVEDARARGLRLARVLPLLVVVIGVALRDVFLRERHAIVAVEVVPVGGDPLEAPTHPLPERSELRVGRPRDREERHVAVREVHERPVDVIREERAAPAAFLPLRREHEVVDDELAPAVEEVGERLLAVRPVEDIARLHADPGEPASLRAQLIAAPREFLLLLEELFPGDEPLVARHDSRTIHLALLRSGARARPAPAWGLHGASSRGARRGRRSRSRPRPTSRRLQCKSGKSAILLSGIRFPPDPHLRRSSEGGNRHPDRLSSGGGRMKQRLPNARPGADLPPSSPGPPRSARVACERPATPLATRPPDAPRCCWSRRDLLRFGLPTPPQRRF